MDETTLLSEKVIDLNGTGGKINSKQKSCAGDSLVVNTESHLLWESEPFRRWRENSVLPVKTSSYFCINMNSSAPSVRADIRGTGQDVVIQGAATCLPAPNRDGGNPWGLSLVFFPLVGE